MQVFISSTHRDLINHRIAVTDALGRLGLYVNGMEKFGAIPKEPRKACLSEIEKCELFVGIYAHRYGHIPSNSIISITEAEFNHAYKNRRPTFCFFVDDIYSWPTEFIDKEPSLSPLRTFKDRVQELIILDHFTTPDVLSTRVTSSIGRYLLGDPRKHGANHTTQFACMTLTQTAAMVFVDIMRLACVAASDGPTKNKLRYNEFVDVADYHLNDFRVQVTRMTVDCDFDTISKTAAVERGLTWGIVRLRREPKLDISWEELIITLYSLAERINILAETVVNECYTVQMKEICSLLLLVEQYSAETLFRSPGDFIKCRLLAQQVVINNMRKTEKFTIATIRDDIDRQLALPYFIVDVCLLRKSTKK